MTNQNPFASSKHYYEHTEWIEEHISKKFNDCKFSVFHEIPTLDIHIDVYFIQPNKTEFNILLTSGMSTLKMNVPKEVKNYKNYGFAELMILIPKNIEFEKVYSGQNKNDWIISMLKRSAKFPHFYDTWIGNGHTLQADEDMTPYGHDTEFVGSLLLPSVTFEQDITVIKKKGRQINIYTIFPLYKKELEYKIENGYNKFLDLLIKADMKEVLNTNRKSLISKGNIWRKIFRN
ncbi:suppressor of fused domain protein [Ancylomarina euxinus]|uniref:Suppressor of fused domain protein n=1 Tax=Ancylomarina euxinus TaxID=2283627 RepID=A0A425XWF4_9BACT|nr:suppressor of fused domain protein [Ancylomarina euxinus]MCZ4696447.1 suppressor of fused domain protein [Ancylomarina euxinus]RRG18972.1 suppressor of fused domain protein [Ancylomarina euxinus]